MTKKEWNLKAVQETLEGIWKKNQKEITKTGVGVIVA